MTYFRKDVACRYATDLRTVDRWKRQGFLPEPHRTPAGRPYWTQAQIEQAERLSFKRVTKATQRAIRRVSRLLKKRRHATEQGRRQNFPVQLTFSVRF